MLLTENKLAHEVFLDKISGFIISDLQDQILINLFKEYQYDYSYINEPVVVEVRKGTEIFQIESSLLMLAMRYNHSELTNHLIDQGARLLPTEFPSSTQSEGVTGFLIDYLTTVTNNLLQVVRVGAKWLGNQEECKTPASVEEMAGEGVLEYETHPNRENISNLCQAVDDKDIGRINDLKSKLTENDYHEILATSFVTSAREHNYEAVKFLLKETEIKDNEKLKTAVFEYYLYLETETQMGNEIIRLLLTQNRLAYEVFFEEIINFLRNKNLSEGFLINLFKDYPDINEPVGVEVIKDGQTLQVKCSLLALAKYFDRPELAKYFSEELGALPAEIPDAMQSEIYAKLFINYLTNTTSNLLQAAGTKCSEFIKWLSGEEEEDLTLVSIVEVVGVDSQVEEMV